MAVESCNLIHTIRDSHNQRFTQSEEIHTIRDSHNQRFTQLEIHTITNSRNQRFTQSPIRTIRDSHLKLLGRFACEGLQQHGQTELRVSVAGFSLHICSPCEYPWMHWPLAESRVCPLLFLKHGVITTSLISCPPMLVLCLCFDSVCGARARVAALCA